MRGLSCLASLVLLTGCARMEHLIGVETISGSGHRETKTFDIDDFDALDIQGPFAVAIKQGEKFEVSIAADDNLFEHFRVTKQGDALHVAMVEGKSVRTREPILASVTMPRLEECRFGGAVHATLDGFKSTDEFHADCEGASTLKGTLDAGKMKLIASGASTIQLAGSAQEATLSAQGASGIDLGKMKLARARVDASGASHATVEASEALDYSVSGASNLKYGGDPKIGKHDVSGASSAKHR